MEPSRSSAQHRELNKQVTVKRVDYSTMLQGYIDAGLPRATANALFSMSTGIRDDLTPEQPRTTQTTAPTTLRDSVHTELSAQLGNPVVGQTSTGFRGWLVRPRLVVDRPAGLSLGASEVCYGPASKTARVIEIQDSHHVHFGGNEAAGGCPALAFQAEKNGFGCAHRSGQRQSLHDAQTRGIRVPTYLAMRYLWSASDLGALYW